jgi:hypothetical protein
MIVTGRSGNAALADSAAMRALAAITKAAARLLTQWIIRIPPV